MSKLERLLNLTAVLLDTERPLSAEEIRRKVHGYPPAGSAFHRAFERDKDDLRVLGIPLLVDRVPATDPPQDGYRIDPDDYYLPDPALEPSELAALHLASMAVRVDGLADQEALWKLGGLDEHDDSAEPMVASLPSNPALVPMFQAVTKKQRVSFGYNGESRDFEPYRLDFRRGRWYVSGLDHGRSAERSFRLDRINSFVEVLGVATGEAVAARANTSEREHAERNASERKGWELGEAETIKVQLQVDAHLVETVAHQLGTTAERLPESGDAGATVFVVPVNNQEAFRSFALGFLEHVEILAPPAVRESMIAWLAEFEVQP